MKRGGKRELRGRVVDKCLAHQDSSSSCPFTDLQIQSAFSFSSPNITLLYLQFPMLLILLQGFAELSNINLEIGLFILIKSVSALTVIRILYLKRLL